MANTGSIEIDFATGNSESSVSVTGQTGILSGSSAEAWMMYESSSEHTANDHSYASLFTSTTCGSVVEGVGFTIYARSTEKLQGKFTVRWVWA